jgi:hypothetical protein
VAFELDTASLNYVEMKQPQVPIYVRIDTIFLSEQSYKKANTDAPLNGKVVGHAGQKASWRCGMSVKY